MSAQYHNGHWYGGGQDIDIQSDPTATSFESGKVPTGGTCQSVLNSILSPQEVSPLTGFSMIKIGKLVVAKFSGMAPLTNQLLIGDAYASYRPKTNIILGGLIALSSNTNDLIASIDIYTNGYCSVFGNTAINTRASGLSSSYGIYGSACWWTA